MDKGLKKKSNSFGYSLDWFGFYRGIDKADDELAEVSRSLMHIFRDTDHLNHIFEKLARDAEKIEDEEKSEKFMVILSYLSDRLYEIGDQCYDISTKIDGVRECNLSELIIEAEEMTEGEKAV